MRAMTSCDSGKKDRVRRDSSIVTGYFMCKSQISLRKFFKLYLEVLFYGIACYAAFVLFGNAPFEWEMIIDSVLPFKSMTSSFVAAFLVFYSLIPFLNILINNLTGCQHLILAILCLLIFSFTSVFHSYRIDIDYIEWFCIVYIVGAYLRLHSKQWMENQKMVTFTLSGIVGVAILSIVAFEFFIKGGYNYFLLADCNKPLAVLVSIFAFLWFRNLKISYSLWINRLASATFGVLLIHTNSDLMRQWLWTDICNVLGVYHSAFYWIIALLQVLGIFAAASVIDLARQKYFERPLLKRFF